MNRRRFLSYSAAALAGSAVPGIKGMGMELPEEADRMKWDWADYREMVRKAVNYRKIDVHNHVNMNGRNPSLIDESCRRTGITWTACSNLRASNPEQMRENNNIVLEAMRQYPNRILGSCYIHPGWPKAALEEIDRCVDQGMVMVGELYDTYKINDPIYYPIIERCIDHQIPVMMHGAAPLGSWRPQYWRHGDNPLSTSTAEDFVDVAERYPEAMLIYGHVGGGGDWEYACKVLRESPTIYAETSGSVADARMIDLAVKYLGADRVMFATDVNYENSVGKIMFADLTEEEREKIFFHNFNNLLKKAGNNVD